MEVDGKEFLRNVGIEQDKDRLNHEQKKLEELKRASIKREQNYMDSEENTEEPAFVDLSMGSDSPNQNTNSYNQVEDIILEKSSANNKKKYIMLGFGLILLFIITVLVIRLISNNDTENQLNDINGINNTSPEIVKEEILNKIDSNEEYQKVIDRKIALEESNEITQKQKKEMNEILIPSLEADNVPLVLDTPKAKVEVKRDLFELDKQAQKAIKPKTIQPKVVEKVIKEKVKIPPKPKTLSKPKREIIVPPAKEKNFTKTTTTSLSGYYIQIGAFTKIPNKNLLKSISTKGYSYRVYKLNIKGKMYNKVLIGSYKTRAEATRDLSKVKSDFKNPSAYILKF